MPTWFNLEFFKFIHKDYTTKEKELYISGMLKLRNMIKLDLSRNTYKPMYQTYRLSRIGVDVGPLSLM